MSRRPRQRVVDRRQTTDGKPSGDSDGRPGENRKRRPHTPSLHVQEIAFKERRPYVCPGCKRSVNVWPCPACLARGAQTATVERGGDIGSDEPQEAGEIRLELPPDEAATAEAIRTGEIVVGSVDGRSRRVVVAGAGPRVSDSGQRAQLPSCTRQQILDAIRQHHQARGGWPTARQLREACGIRALRDVKIRLRALERKGLVVRAGDGAEAGVRLTGLASE